MIQIEGELFEAVQNPGVFKDTKTFVDAIPKCDEAKIMKAYHQACKDPHFSLEVFLREYFILPHDATSPKVKIENDTMEHYIDSLWHTLERIPAEEKENDTLIPLKHPYIVPGGRFREIYYWDSYFTAEGLATIDRYDLIEGMVKNFVYLQSKLGLIPNGNRQYYKTRSQPPVLCFMIDLLYQKYGLDHIKPYIPALEKEHAFWMNGQEELNADNAKHLRVVRMPNGAILNRYCDPLTIPRPESHTEDLKLANGLSEENAKKLYQNIRSAAESGWDFTARWFKDEHDFHTIQTTCIVPVDLNALLYGLERLIAKYHRECGNEDLSKNYDHMAETRKDAINQYCWNEDIGCYFDYNIETQKQNKFYSLATVVPLFVNMATPKQASQVKNHLQEKFLRPGGLVTTLIDTNQQWDSPNGWAPLQWFAVKGLMNYQSDDPLAIDIMTRWLHTLRSNFEKMKMLMEKYNVCDVAAGRGGEYSVQEGFGWTNGIALKFIALLNTN